MKRLLIAAVLMLLWAASSFGQTTVNLTVSDLPDGQTWNNGTWQVHLILPGFPGDARFTIISGGGSLADQSGSLSGTGTASFSLPANANIAPAGSIWRFTVCPDASAGCSIAAVTITTSSPQAVTINPNSIRINVAVSTPPFWAYADGEIQNAVKGSSYFNTALLQDRICTTNPVSGGTCTVWTGPNGGTAAAAGTVGQTQINDNASPGTIGATGCLSFPDKTVGPTTSNCNARFKGPNPYVDATAFGVRALVTNATPAISGITATTTAGQPTVTVSTSSCPSQTSSVCFVNGDGVVVFNAGATQAMATPAAPTVTPSNSRVMTGTGDGVAAPAGATTFNYLWFWCDVGGGCTAPSPAGSTATGNALGAQPLAITSATRSNDTLTFNTASQPNISVGTMVHTDGFSNADNAAGFNGWWRVATVTAGGFTVTSTGLDTRNGASTASAGGGTANWFNYNKVTVASAPAGAYRGFVCSDRATPGTFHLLGMALLPINPNSASFTDGTLEFDDFGATMMAASATAVPWYVSDANCTGAATNDNWVTTIASGAGTTTLTMSGNAPNSVTGGTIRFDNAPNILTATTSAGTAPVELPFTASGGYVTNSVLDLSSSTVPLLLPVGATFNDTVLTGTGMRWYGDRLPGVGPHPAFASANVPVISGLVGQPGVFKTGGISGEVTSLYFSGPSNGIAFMQDGTGGNLGPWYDRTNFASSTNSNDYMGRAFVCRGAVGASCTARFGTALFLAGTQSMTDTSATPAFYCDDCGLISMDHVMGSGRTMLFRADSAGQNIKIGTADWQAGTAPLITVTGQLNSSGNAGTSLSMYGPTTLDTMAEAGVAYLQSTGTSSVFVTCGGGGSGCGSPSSAVPGITGARAATINGVVPSGVNRDSFNNITVGNALDGVLNTTFNQVSYSVSGVAAAIGVSPAYPIFIQSPTMAAPTCSVSAGGSVSIGTHTYQVASVWWNGSADRLSPSVSCTTSSGNQTVQISWTTISGNPKGYMVTEDGLVRGNGGGWPTCGTVPMFPPSTVSFTATTDTNCGTYPSNIAAGGPTMLMPGTQGIAAPALTLAGVNTQKVMLQSVYTNATTTPSNITGLSFSASANTNYHMSCDVYFQGSVNTAGLDITITGPAAPTNVFYSLDEDSTNATNINSVASAFGTKLVAQNVTATTNLHAYISLGLQNGATAGTVQVQGSATGVGTVTVQPGSACWVN